MRRLRVLISAGVAVGLVGWQTPSVSAAPTAVTFTNGVLTLPTFSDDVTVTCGIGKKVFVNDEVTSPDVSCAAVVSIALTVVGAPPDIPAAVVPVVVDLSAIDRGRFAAIRTVTTTTTAAVTVFGSDVVDVITLDAPQLASAFGRGGADRLSSTGNNTIDGGVGDDVVDMVLVDGCCEDLVALGGPGNDRITVTTRSFGDVDVRGGDGNDRIDLVGNFGVDGVIAGDAGDDRISGGSVEVVNGGVGFDRYVIGVSGTFRTSIKSSVQGGLESVRVGRTGVRELELIQVDLTGSIPDAASLDTALLRTVAIQARIAAPDVGVVVRVPGGGGQTDPTARTVTAPGFKTFRWVIEPRTPSPSIRLKVVAS
jgi:hypothetical protein